jgi:hypothetical protein
MTTRTHVGFVGVLVSLAACGGSDNPGLGGPDGDASSSAGSSTAVDDASSTTETTVGSVADSSTGAPAPLLVDCNEPPMAAVGASYHHTPLVTGDDGSATWSMTGLPPGLVFNPIGGTIYGPPEMEGSYDVEVTATEDDRSDTQTCTISVGPSLTIDFGALGKPCIEPGDDIAQFASGGDGSALSCGTVNGSGNGSRPPGITVNPDTCMIEGAIEDGYGTWVWITRVVQAGYETLVPYCATQDVLPMGWYVIDGDHSGQTGNVLEPKIGTFAPGRPVAWGGAGDPVIRVTGPCGPNSCYYGYALGIGGSQFDDVSLAPAMLMSDANGDPIGFMHSLSATGDAVAESFESRPWVLSWNLQYCISAAAADCADTDAIQANGLGFLRFATIMLPE